MRWILLIFMLTGCASLVAQKDEALVSEVKKVAIVAISADQPTSAIQVGGLLSQPSSHVTQMYNSLRKNLSKNMGWKVLDIKRVQSNSGYRSAYKDTMEGFQNKSPMGSGRLRYGAPQIMDIDSPRILGEGGRDKLIQALGVDAIVAVRVNVHLKSFTIMGIGSRKPQARVSFYLYKRGHPNPIWFDGNIDGEVAEESVGATAFVDVELLNKLSVESAETAFRKIGKKE